MSGNVITVSVPVLTVTPTPTTTMPSQPVGAAGADPASASSVSATPVAGISNGGFSSSGGQQEEYDAGSLVFHIDLFLLALIGLLVLLRAPRLLARLGRPFNWFRHGHLLRYAKRSRPIRRVGHHGTDLPLPAVGAVSGKVEMTSAESHTLYTHEYLYNREGRHGRHGRLPRGAAPQFPAHLSACPKALRELGKPLGWRVAPGFSLAQLLVCGLWFVVTLYATLYQSSGTFTDPVRAGWVGVAQLPFVFAFASKNNVIGGMLGLGYEKLNFLHRFVARLVVLAVNVHTVGYIYKWTLAGTFTASIQKPAFYWGLIGTICLDGLFFFSTSWWRQKAYNVFIFTHVVCFILLLPAAYLHRPGLIPYVLACIGVYALDHILRVIKTRVHTAVLHPLNELGTTHVEIRGVNAGWRAGQHVRIRVLSSGMGLLGWTEAHPFTIASAAGSGEGMVLMCKKTGGWTSRLYDLAKAGEYNARRSRESGMGFGHGETKVKLIVEGPYGGPGPAELSSYSAAVLVCGGSGISFGLAVLEELVRRDARGESRVKLIEFVWCARDPASLVPVLPRLQALVHESIYTTVRVSVFYTRAPVGKFPFAEDFFKNPARLNLSPGRPKIGKILETTMNRTVGLGSALTREKEEKRNCGVIVGVCGPPELADDVAREVRRVDPTRRDQVGGVEVYEEVFGW